MASADERVVFRPDALSSVAPDTDAHHCALYQSLLGLYARVRLFRAVRPLFGRGVRWFGYVYLAAMVFRYIIHMSLYPETRWFGGTIPIVFHWVLARFIIVFGEYHRGRLTQSSRPV